MLDSIWGKVIFDVELEYKPSGLSKQILLFFQGLKNVVEGFSAIGGSLPQKRIVPPLAGRYKSASFLFIREGG